MTMTGLGRTLLRRSRRTMICRSPMTLITLPERGEEVVAKLHLTQGFCPGVFLAWRDAGFASNKLWCDAFALQKLGHLRSRANKKMVRRRLRRLWHHRRLQQKRASSFFVARLLWCPEQDLNLHTLRHMLLRHTCIPISPSGRDSIIAS